MTDTTTTPTVRTVAELVAAELGAGWSFEPGNYDSSAFITGPEGIRLHVWTNSYPLRNERAEIVGQYPEHAPYGVDRHAITVSLSKPAARIAGDITRRLLPDFLPDLESAQAGNARHLEYVERANVNAARLTWAQPTMLSVNAWRSSETSHEYSVRAGEVYGTATITGSDTPVSLELRSLTVEQAERVLAALADA